MQLADAGAYPVSNTPLVKGMTGYDAALERRLPVRPGQGRGDC